MRACVYSSPPRAAERLKNRENAMQGARAFHAFSAQGSDKGQRNTNLASGVPFSPFL